MEASLSELQTLADLATEMVNAENDQRINELSQAAAAVGNGARSEDQGRIALDGPDWTAMAKELDAQFNDTNGFPVSP